MIKKYNDKKIMKTKNIFDEILLITKIILNQIGIHYYLG